MQTEELIKYLNQPQKLEPAAIDKLLQVEKEYPFFQTAKLLVLKYTYVTDKASYQSKLENVAPYVTDRRILYKLIYPLDEPENLSGGEKVAGTSDSVRAEHDEQAATQQIEEKKKGSLQENISTLLNEQMEEFEAVHPESEALTPEIAIDIHKEYQQPGEFKSISSKEMNTTLLVLGDEEAPVEKDITQDLKDIKTGETVADILEICDTEAVHSKDIPPVEVTDDAEGIPSNKKNDSLIEEFIRKNPRLVPLEEKMSQIDISEDSVKEHEGFFTETLAKIYLRQGYYNKAIFTYEKLILKYPEKSDYFASQIEEIKKLNNKL